MGLLTSDIVQNPRNNGLCMAITTRSCKVLPGMCLGVHSCFYDVELKDEVHDENLMVS